MKTNDPREINLGHEMAMNAIKCVRHEYFPGERGFPLSILAGKIVGYLKKGGILSCSFSHFGDSLPMWREYADDCSGVSIGFRPTAIKAMPIRIQRVKYLEDTNVDHLVELVRELTEPLVQEFGEPSLETWMAASTGIISAIVSAKHGSWTYEEEIRGTHAAVAADGDTEINGVPIPAYEYPDGKELFTDLRMRKSGKDDVRFIELPFGKYKNGEHNPMRAIEKVILGPQCDVTQKEIARRLLALGFSDFEIVCSECKIR